MTRYREDARTSKRLTESSKWLFRRLMEAEAVKLESAAQVMEHDARLLEWVAKVKERNN